jgi:hypothetical protein
MRKNGIFMHGVSVFILTVFVLLALGSGSSERATREETREREVRLILEEAARKKAEQEAKWARENAQGYIELVSDVVGTVMINGTNTTYTVSSGSLTPLTLTIDNANGEYTVAVRDSKGTVYPARNTVSLKGRSRTSVVVEDPNYVPRPNAPADFTFIQNTAGGLTITGYKSNSRRVVIPETISGVKVTEIGGNAFARKHYVFAYNNFVESIYVDRDKPSLIRLIIPNTVTTIGENAFAGNDLLNSLVIPDSVTSVGKSTFNSCGLVSLSLGNKLVDIGEYAFCQNNLKEIKLPASLRTIGMGAFSENQLSSITIPNGVTVINAITFFKNNLRRINLPASLKTIGTGAFIENQLTSITIPNGVTSIGNYAFSSNPLTSITIPNDVISIGENAFGNLYTSIVIPSSLAMNGELMVSERESSKPKITSITLPANVADKNLRTNFEQSFVNFYISQNRKAGGYTKDENGIWRVR